LSEEYFTNRLDRYVSFTNGGGGLVDFYAELCDVLCKYAVRFDGNKNEKSSASAFLSSHDDFDRKLELEESLAQLFNGERIDHVQSEMDQNRTPPTVAYAIPTFQIPESFLGRPLRFYSDVQSTRNLLHSALAHDSSLSVRLSSAYLNLTPSLLSILTQFGKCNEDAIASNGSVYLLTAGSKSHGFAPKKQSNQSSGIVHKIKDSIPDAFLSLVKQVAESITKCGGMVLLYEKTGWTFHAKGLWITSNDQRQVNVRPLQRELIHDSSTLVSTFIGSGNYGARSEDLDVESNLVLVFNNSHAENESQDVSMIKNSVAAEWNEMCRYSSELVDTNSSSGAENAVVQVVVALLKKFL
jgi:CDP-diacylglycerol--glycerol-3-phosphate 3-phosphatidyltransferase